MFANYKNSEKIICGSENGSRHIKFYSLLMCNIKMALKLKYVKITGVFSQTKTYLHFTMMCV